VQRFLARRIFQSVLVVAGVLTVVFALVRLSGDPITLFITEETPKERIPEIRRQLGLDRPLPLQYVHFWSQVLRGDFGLSLRFQEPALGVVLERLGRTVELAVASTIVATALAIPLGVLSAWRRGSAIDHLAVGLALAGQSLPVFWVGIMLVAVFAVELRILPTSGTGTWRHLVLPTVTLAIYSLGTLTRLTRSSMLEVLGQEYVRTARAKGLPEEIVLRRHALKNASLAVITMLGFEFSVMLGGAIITETVFAWPGVGRLIVQAITVRDYPLVQATLFVLALFVIAINLAIDIAYATLDPRIRFD
jgi:peptide/nickel transport system permease protein